MDEFRVMATSELRQLFNVCVAIRVAMAAPTSPFSSTFSSSPRTAANFAGQDSAILHSTKMATAASITTRHFSTCNGRGLNFKFSGQPDGRGVYIKLDDNYSAAR